jgi:glucose-6-phosphate dehydrogenase assembly protein OpcA
MQQIHIGQVLDVAAVERELRILWQDSAGAQIDDESLLMRARVANIIVLLPDESGLEELNQTLEDLSGIHPNRAIVSVAERHEPDRDIELFISSFCQSDNRGGNRLSCEEIILIARGRFVPELPSAALPLLISDLPTFLWCNEALEFEDRTFLDFSRAADRLIIDSVDTRKSGGTMLALAKLFAEGRQQQLGISDINWARLTSWRALIASFYDSPRCKVPLNQLTSVIIDYSAPEHEPDEIAPQALLILGWLGSRLKWQLSPDSAKKAKSNLRLEVISDHRRIAIDLNLVARPDIRPGRLARVQLNAEQDRGEFVVLRDQRGLHLESHVEIDGLVHPGRVLPVRNRSTAQLLSRELEILTNDNIYAEAVSWAADLLQHIDIGPKPSV